MSESSTALAGGGIEILPVHGIPEIRQGDDLAAALQAGFDSLPGGVQDGDVLCVSTKILSKALGLVIDPSQKEAAIDRASLREVVRRDHEGTITRVVLTRSGPVMAAAGIDASNSPGGLLLLPEDPDGEADALRAELERRTGRNLGVILTDTSSRIWRMGVGDIALGSSGVRVLQDLRGTADTAGRTMGVTVRNLGDEIAAAADLVKGKTEGVPAAVVRGVRDALDEDAPGARGLNRAGEDDWFRTPSLESVWTALGLTHEEQPVAAMAPEADEIRIARALEIALHPDGASGTRGTAGPQIRREGSVMRVSPAGPAPADLARAGAVAERLRTALRAEELAAPLAPWEVEALGVPAAEAAGTALGAQGAQS